MNRENIGFGNGMECEKNEWYLKGRSLFGLGHRLVVFFLSPLLLPLPKASSPSPTNICCITCLVIRIVSYHIVPNPQLIHDDDKERTDELDPFFLPKPTNRTSSIILVLQLSRCTQSFPDPLKKNNHTSPYPDSD